MGTNEIFLIVCAGIFGTLAMDIMSVLATHLGILSGPVKPSLIGRWGLNLAIGRFRHRTIAQTPAIAGETFAGILIHYSIGISLAFVYFYIAARVGFSADNFTKAVTFGLLTNVFPWFILFPSYGFGVCGMHGRGLFFSSTFNHLIYGAALGAVFWMAAVHQPVMTLSASAAPTKSAALNIYVPGSYTGVVPFVAEDIYAAVKAFADETNAHGGLLGRKIQVIKQDDKADVTAAQKNAEVALKDPNHLVTVGHNFSSIALPIGKEYAQSNRLFFTPYATSAKISAIGGTVFQLCYNDDFQGATLGDVAYKRIGARRIAVITNQSDVYSQGLSDNFIRQVKRLDEKSKSVTIQQVNFLSDMLDPDKVVEQITAFQADLIFLPENKMRAAELIRVFQESSIGNLPILGADGWGSEQANIGMYFEKAQSKADKLSYFYTYHWVSSIDTQVNRAHLKKLTKAKGKKVYGPGILSYEGLTHLRSLIEKHKTLDNAKLATLMRGSRYEGTTGSVHFHPKGHTVRDMVLLRLGADGVSVDSFVRPQTD